MNLDPTSFNSWSNMKNRFPPHYSYPNSQWHPPTHPIMQNPTPWMPWETHSKPQDPWSIGWRNPYPGNKFPHNKALQP